MQTREDDIERADGSDSSIDGQTAVVAAIGGGLVGGAAGGPAGAIAGALLGASVGGAAGAAADELNTSQAEPPPADR